MKKHFLLSLLSLSFFYSGTLFSESELNHLYTPELTPENAPWLTGTLLTPSAHTLPFKHVNVEPYVFFTTVTGVYNKNWKNEQLPHNFYALIEQNWVQIGINDFLDVQIVPQITYQFTQGVRSTQTGDLPLFLDVQLYNDSPGTRWPAIKLLLGASAPVGKYHNLSPDKLGTDGVGSGSWRPSAGIAFSRLYQLPNKHFLAPRLSINYTMPLSAKVKGLSVYGGALDTSGKVYDGNTLWVGLAGEYTLTRNWVFSMDLTYQHQNKTRFYGNPGTDLLGLPVKIKTPSNELFTVAPAIEYNWSANVGMIAGVWLSIKGRNAGNFTTGVLAINMFI